MYSLLMNYGIKPWEFGEMTFPWLKAIMAQGKVEESPEALEWNVRRARAIAKEFTSRIGGK